MSLRDPVAVYNAATNMEAGFVRDALVASGIEAFLTEDFSLGGTWIGGFLPEIHKPQVWVERADIDRAKPVLDEFERRATELRKRAAAGPAIEVVCEECRRSASFPAAQKGSVQQCPDCGAYIDVGEGEAPEGWEEGESETEEP